MAQLEIKYLLGNTYYIPGSTNIGIYEKEGEITLIDTGIDKDRAKRILRCIEEKGWLIKNIINTHSHADHIGGNAYLVEKTGCSIIASKGEAPYIEDTLIEPSFLYGGFPHKGLRNKFLMAKSSAVTHGIESEGFILDTGLQAFELHGHSMDMIGVRTPENIVFIGDSLLPENIVLKYHLCYLWDLGAQFKTFEDLKAMEATLFVPSHGEVIEEVSELVAVNRDKIQEVIYKILAYCEEKVTPEQVIEYLCRTYEVHLNATQYVLVSNTIKSYLAYLSNEGLIEASYEQFKMTWEKR